MLKLTKAFSRCIAKPMNQSYLMSSMPKQQISWSFQYLWNDSEKQPIVL